MTSTPPDWRKFLVCALVFFQGATVLHARSVNAGLAWHVQGKWQIRREGAPFAQAMPLSRQFFCSQMRSRRSLHNCILQTRARARARSIVRRPDPFALQMLARIGTVRLAQPRHESKPGIAPTVRRRQHARKAWLHSTVLFACRMPLALSAGLPNGRYTFTTSVHVTATIRHNFASRSRDNPMVPRPLRHRRRRCAGHPTH